MLSKRFVVSRAASSLLSWRLAVFIFHCLLVGCLGAALCFGAACARTVQLVGVVRPGRVASTATGADLWLPLCLGPRVSAEALQLKASASLRALANCRLCEDYCGR